MLASSSYQVQNDMKRLTVTVDANLSCCPNHPHPTSTTGIRVRVRVRVRMIEPKLGIILQFPQQASKLFHSLTRLSSNPPETIAMFFILLLPGRRGVIQRCVGHYARHRREDAGARGRRIGSAAFTRARRRPCSILMPVVREFSMPSP
jgi:hypothetical protein